MPRSTFLRRIMPSSAVLWLCVAFCVASGATVAVLVRTELRQAAQNAGRLNAAQIHALF